MSATPKAALAILRRASRAGLPLACAGALACGAPSEREPAPELRASTHAAPGASTAVRPASEAAPPSFAYVAASAWRSTRPSVPEVVPPDPARETWRALVSRNQPLQKKTPHWQPLPAERSVELAMPEGSVHRCVLTPLSTSAESDDFGVKLQAWVLARRLLCSSDGFRSWTEHGHVVRVLPDGTREVTVAGGALLRERGADGRVHESFVLVRSDPEQRNATTGPPRILPGLARVDD